MLNALRGIVRRAEDRWFDVTRSVETSDPAQLEGLRLAGERADGFMYLPCRASNVRAAMREAPCTEWSDYCFLDLGSGAGRLLFVAAEYPFRRVRGVEFAAELHELAERNIERLRWHGIRCHDIRSIHANAVGYQLPEENLVIAMFNPFGAETTRYLVRNLDESLRSHPRDIVAMMFYPEFGSVMDTSKQLRLVRATRKFRIYRSICCCRH